MGTGSANIPINKEFSAAIRTATSVDTLPHSLYATRWVRIITPTAHRLNEPAGMPVRNLEKENSVIIDIIHIQQRAVLGGNFPRNPQPLHSIILKLRVKSF